MSAHQPVYLPGLILFHKIALSDVFVLLPDVQFQRHSWQQRNRVRNGKDAISCRCRSENLAISAARSARPKSQANPGARSI
ncbi:MAG: WbqC family protein [Oceanicaulis sp.]|nr:WbqC family protein [Oceanicaulis sp.]